MSMEYEFESTKYSVYKKLFHSEMIWKENIRQNLGG